MFEMPIVSEIDKYATTLPLFHVPSTFSGYKLPFLVHAACCIQIFDSWADNRGISKKHLGLFLNQYNI